MREQSWSDAVMEHGRILAVTQNPVSQALAELASVVGRDVRVLSDDQALAELRAAELGPDDAVVLCDHDTPDRDELLHLALISQTGYVAMLGSRTRAERTYAELAASHDQASLARLRVPAGLNLGGRSPGEMALSLLAEIVAVGYDRPGGSMRAGN